MASQLATGLWLVTSASPNIVTGATQDPSTNTLFRPHEAGKKVGRWLHRGDDLRKGGMSLDEVG